MTNSKGDKGIAYPDHVFDVGSASVLFEEFGRARTGINLPDIEKSIIGGS
jgi:hypothetical protein